MAWTGRTPVHQFHKMAGNDLVTTADFQAWADSLEAGARTAYTNSATPTDLNGYGTNRSRGTFAAPASVQADDRLGWVSGRGYHSTGTPGYTDAAVVGFHADGAVSGNFVPGRIGFYTSTASALAERVRLTSAGNMRGM